MNLTKRNFIKLFSREYGYRQNDISIVYDDMLDFMSKHLRKGHSLRFNGAFTIYTEITPPCVRKTPQGEEVNVPYRARLKCKISPTVKESLRHLKEIDGVPLEELYLQALGEGAEEDMDKEEDE